MAYYVVTGSRKARDRLLPWVRRRGQALAVAEVVQLVGLHDHWSELVVAVAPGGRPTREWLGAVQGLRTSFPRVGVVLMMDLSDGPVGTDALPPVDGLLPMDASEAAVLGVLDAAVVRGPLRELAADASRLPEGRVRGAVVALLHARPPYRTRKDLAEATLTSVSTLSHGWPEVRASLGLRDGLRFRDLLGVTRLTCAIAERRSRVARGSAVAGEAEGSRNTLERWSEEVLSCSLEESDGLEAVEIAARIERWLRSPPK